MRIKENLCIYLGFIGILVVFGVYNYINESQWIIDNTLGIILLSLLFVLGSWLRLDKKGFFFVCLTFLIHNLGTFGFYELRWGFFGYDDLVHLTVTILFGYIVSVFLGKSILLKKTERIQKFSKIFTFILIGVSLVMFFSVIIELIEFAGFMFLEPGEGILFYGAGDATNPAEVKTQYIDTMVDLCFNFIGTMIGILFYYLFNSKMFNSKKLKLTNIF